MVNQKSHNFKVEWHCAGHQNEKYIPIIAYLHRVSFLITQGHHVPVLSVEVLYFKSSKRVQTARICCSIMGDKKVKFPWWSDFKGIQLRYIKKKRLQPSTVPQIVSAVSLALESNKKCFTIGCNNMYPGRTESLHGTWSTKNIQHDNC